MKTYALNIIAFCFTVYLGGQSRSLDSIQYLDEIILSDVKLKKGSEGHKILTLNDSVIRKNGSNSTDLLRYNSTIYFRENGYGMISSASFRGTNASHTAVIWNGININSQLNGQVDFSTLKIGLFDDVTVRSGGSSVKYGSGAIGGSIHLEDVLQFDTTLSNELRLQAGSFNSQSYLYALNYGSKRVSVSFGLNYISSDNDYEYLGTDQLNENGDFENFNSNLTVGYVLNENHVLKLYQQSFIGDRGLSGTLVAPSNNGYEDRQFRNMLEWSYVNDSWFSSLKTAYLIERFNYYENRDKEESSFGELNSFIAQHTLSKSFNSNIKTTLLTEFSNFNGDGTNFGDPSRNNLGLTAIFQQSPNDQFDYQVQIRKDFTQDFDTPFLFGIGMDYEFSDLYQLKFNFSTNFRVPTFNDLHWQPGGNDELEPESSFQVDLGHVVKFSEVSLSLNTFYIETEDMINWRPNIEGFWSPVNVASVRNYGLEVQLDVPWSMNGHSILAQLQYAYTIAEDLNTSEALIYVPEHKATFNTAYNYKKWTAFYQHLIVGSVQIIGGELDGFNVGNFGVGYKFNISNSVSSTINFRVNNIFNQDYQNIAFRPMPNRNYNLELLINI